VLDMQTEPQMHVFDDKADLAGCGNAACTPAPEGECRTGLTCAASVTSARMLTTCIAGAPFTALQVFPCTGLPCAGGHSRYCGRLSLRGAVLLTAAALLLVAVIVTVPAIVFSTSKSHHAANSTQQLSPQVPLALPCLLTSRVRT
jgi:hypothetical protein